MKTRKMAEDTAVKAEDTAVKAEDTAVKAEEATDAEAKDHFISDLQKTVSDLEKRLLEVTDALQEQKLKSDRETRLRKAGIPDEFSQFLRDDADLEAFSDALKSSAANSNVADASTPSLPTVGARNPGGEVLSVDELLERATQNNDKEAISLLKLAKLASAANSL